MLLPTKTQANLDRLVYVLDPQTYITALNMPSVKSLDVNSAATVESGVLMKIWGIDIHKTGFQQLATANGKVNVSATSANTKGRISLLRPDRMHIRWKRRMRTSTEYQAKADVNEIVAHMRWGFAFQDMTGIAGAYNVKADLS